MTKRVNGEKITAPISELEEKIPSLLDEIHQNMYDKAKAFLNSHISDVDNLDDLKDRLEKGGYVRMPYCGHEACELKIKELTNGGTARCIYKDIDDGTICPVCGEKSNIVAYFAKAY